MKKTCTFFGHRDCPASVMPKLRTVLVDLIEHHGVEQFYVGRQGNFDTMVRAVLRELAKTHPQIRYAVVLEQLPKLRGDARCFSDAIFPEGMEDVPPRFAISRRNEWMLRRADMVVTYVTHSWGGAAQYAKKAGKQGKIVLNLA